MKLSVILCLTTVLFARALQAHATPMAWMSELDALSLVTRYAGMGYNLLMANPEGDFYRGGVDPGIKSTHFIFKHTYSQGKQAFYMGKVMQVPDQVVFHTVQSCAMLQTTNAYSGQTSYKKELSVNTETSGN